MSVANRFEVVGAQGARAFFRSLGTERLSHGYLFTGPAGVGKKTFALRLAQSLLCETPKDGVLGYCGECTGCTLFVARTHPDFVFSEGVVKIGKDSSSSSDESVSARELIRELSMHAYRGRYHVVLLGDVSFATHEAANALLKTLEEPPPGVVVILTSNAPGALIDTIRSRMCEVAFPPLAVKDVESVLLAEGVPEADSHRAAQSSLGSITRARAALDGDSKDVRDASFAWFEDVMRGESGNTAFLGLDDRSLTGAQKRENVRELIEIVRIAARDWAMAALTDGSIPPLAADQSARIATIPARDTQSVTVLLGALGGVERLAHSNVSPGLVVDFLRTQLSPLAKRPAP